MDGEPKGANISASPLRKPRYRRKLGYLPMTTITSFDVPTDDELAGTRIKCYSLKIYININGQIKKFSHYNTFEFQNFILLIGIVHKDDGKRKSNELVYEMTMDIVQDLVYNVGDGMIQVTYDNDLWF